MEAAAVKDLFEKVLPKQVIEKFVVDLGVQRRLRLFDPPTMVMALVMLGGTAAAGRIAAAVREYSNVGYFKVARSALYMWFDEAFCNVMRDISSRALPGANNRERHLPDMLAGRKDWRAFDAATVKLDDALKEQLAGAGDYAALEVHVELSLGAENVVDYSILSAITAARKQTVKAAPDSHRARAPHCAGQ